jgi:pimeloyl-ACP methyl ester carboxylesterase
MMSWLRRATRVVAVIGVILGCASGLRAGRADDVKSATKAKPQASAAAQVQHLEGTLEVRPGIKLRMVVNVRADDQGATVATLDSPDEGREGFKLDPFSLSPGENRLAFELKATGAKYEGKLNGEGTEAVGTWSQRGVQLPLTFRQTKTPTPVAKIVGPEQAWEGKLGIGAGLSLRIVVHVGKTAEGKLMATMDSPDQGAKGFKVDTITLDKTKLTFEMKALLAKYEGKLNAEGTETVGTWTQASNSLPLTLKKTDKATELRRPQTPKAPFPYKVVEISYQNKTGGVTLAGTLTEPEGPGPFPALILISGSGAQDRDETIFEHKPFLVLADTLTRRGIAVLRLDDRGVGGSTGSTSSSTSDDFAGDVLAGMAFLRTRSELDPRRIGLMGHSEGGIIAPMVAARSPDVAFIVLMAGTGLPGEEILYLQGRAILKAMGADEKALKQQLDLQKRLFEIVKTEKDEKTAETRMRDVAKAAVDSLPEDQRKALGNANALIAAQLKMVRSPWFRYFLTYDPRPTLTKVHCPVLALIGEKDLQVPPRENLSQIESTLKTAGNNRVTVKELPGLNHLFQTCKTGAPSEYAQIEQTIDPGALAVIADWISQQVGSPGK